MGNKDDPHPCKKLAKLTALIILFLTAYLLGYSSHNQTITPNPQPTSVSNINVDHQDFSYIKCADPVATGTERQVNLDKVSAAHLRGKTSLRRTWHPISAVTVQYGGNGIKQPSFLTPDNPIQTQNHHRSFLDASANHMARIARKLDLDTLIICLDDFRSCPLHPPLKMINGDSILLHQFMLNVETANATENIIFLEIDAAHDFHSAWNDINNGYKVLRPGGVLFGHDIGIDGVKRAVEIFAKLHGFQVKVVLECDEARKIDSGSSRVSDLETEGGKPSKAIDLIGLSEFAYKLNGSESLESVSSNNVTTHGLVMLGPNYFKNPQSQAQSI